MPRSALRSVIRAVLSDAPAPEAPTSAEFVARWQASRVDVRESTLIQHRTALGHVLPLLGSRPGDEITTQGVAGSVAKMNADGSARESVRKSLTALAMVLDFAGVTPAPPGRIAIPWHRCLPG